MIQQGTPEWFAARCGCLTASRIDEAVARTKSGWGSSRANLMGQLVAERLTGVPMETYTNGAMQWGLDHEAEARTAYEFLHDATVTEAGFILHPTIPMTGASPDGLVGDDGLVEFKAPNTATHIDTLINRTVPDKYVKQVLWQMACTGRQWCDYCSFDPRLPEDMRLFVKRIPRDDKAIAAMEEMVRNFLDEVDTTVRILRREYGGQIGQAA